MPARGPPPQPNTPHSSKRPRPAPSAHSARTHRAKYCKTFLVTPRYAPVRVSTTLRTDLRTGSKCLIRPSIYPNSFFLVHLGTQVRKSVREIHRVRVTPCLCGGGSAPTPRPLYMHSLFAAYRRICVPGGTFTQKSGRYTLATTRFPGTRPCVPERRFCRSAHTHGLLFGAHLVFRQLVRRSVILHVLNHLSPKPVRAPLVLPRRADRRRP